MFVVQTEDVRCGELVFSLRRMGYPAASFPLSRVGAIPVDRVAVVFDDPNTALAVADLLPGVRVILCGNRFCAHEAVTRVDPGEGYVGRIQAAARAAAGDEAEVHRVGTVSFDGDGPWFCGERLYLSPTETLLLRLLASFRETFFSAKMIASYVGCSARTVAPSVCRINEKSTRLSGRPVIEAVRGFGYKVK